MSAANFTCPVCGHNYDRSAKGVCGACPMNSGCEMVCCPNCGHATIDPSQSAFVRLAEKLFHGRRYERSGAYHENFAGRPDPPQADLERDLAAQPASIALEVGLPLTSIGEGEEVRIAGFGPGISPGNCARLQAYGLVPGFRVQVLQQSSVTVVRVDHLELAIESELAGCILVAPC